MKKIILGVLCGVTITIPLTVFAATQVTAYLYPSKVTIYKGDSLMTLNSAESPFINYNNRIYVPLRTFSEAIGCHVDFEAASSGDGGINTINVYHFADMKPIQDSEGYVDLYVTEIADIADVNNITKIFGLVKYDFSLE